MNDLTLLDPYAGRVGLEESRVDPIATISAGYRDKQSGLPQASRNGEIHIHDPEARAIGLADALKRGGGKQLTIALVHEPNAGGFRQRYSRYSRTALEAFGDEFSITRIGEKDGKPVRATFYACRPLDSALHSWWDGLSPEERQAHLDKYTEIRLTCKADTFIYFCLAEWDQAGPRMVFPDGFGCYRLRMTSRNSVRNFLAAVRDIGGFTGGKVAGIPLTISIHLKDVAGPDGKRRNVPVWSFVMRPPVQLALGVSDVRNALTRGLNEVSQLALPAPDEPSLEAAAIDLDSALDEEAIEKLGRGSVDSKSFRATFFAIAADTVLEDKSGRAPFLLGACKELGFDFSTDSLAEFVTLASPEQADQLLSLTEAVVLNLRKMEADRKLSADLQASIKAASAARVAGSGERVTGPEAVDAVVVSVHEGDGGATPEPNGHSPAFREQSSKGAAPDAVAPSPVASDDWPPSGMSPRVGAAKHFDGEPVTRTESGGGERVTGGGSSGVDGVDQTVDSVDGVVVDDGSGEAASAVGEIVDQTVDSVDGGNPAPSAEVQASATADSEPFGEMKRPPYEFTDQQQKALLALAEQVEGLDPEFTLKGWLQEQRKLGISQGLVYARLERVRDELKEAVAELAKTPA